MTEQYSSLRLVDGRPEPSGVISRAELLGQGLFETLRWNGQRFPLVTFHEARLRRGAAWLGYDPDAVIAAFRTELASHVIPELPSCPAIVRFQWSHRQTERGYRSLPGTPVTLWQWSRTAPDLVRSLDQLEVSHRPMTENPGPPVKHTSRADQVMAAAESGAGQIRCDRDGWLREGLSGNLVFWRHGHLCTPSLDHHGVEGTLLGWLCDFYRIQGWPMLRGDFPPAALADAQAALLVNATGAQVIHGFRQARYNTQLPQLQTTLQAIRQLFS